MTPLYKLSNQDLEVQLKDLVQKERKLLHVILEHIKEVDRRQLYLAKAYPSLFEYLVKEMNYSGSAAMRRIEAARLLREVPALAQKIEEGAVNLSQIGELSRAVKEKERLEKTKVSPLQKTELIEKISSQTLFESQKILAETLDLPMKTHDTQRVQKDQSVRLEITVSQSLYEELLRCKDQAAHTLKQNHQDTSWESVLQVLVSQYLKKSTPSKPTPPRSPKPAKEKTGNEPQTEPNTAASVLDCETKASSPNPPHPQNPPRVPLKTRREVLQRDQCCQYQDPHTGKKCQSTFALQVDHRQPQWVEGSHDLANLQVLCAAHNTYKYRQESATFRI